MTSPAVPIEPAATIVLLQDSEQGPKVLMQQRNPDAAFVGGAWVFPGGKLDPHDQDFAWLSRCDLCPESANRILDVEAHGHAYWIAAIREMVEEAGILLAEAADSALAQETQRYLQQYPSGFIDFCNARNLVLETGHLRYLSRWVTPLGNPKRYDTRFFLCPWPEGQEPTQDDHEAIDTRWVTPEQALELHRTNEWLLILPTIMTLRQISGFDSVTGLLHALGQAASAKTR